jgi:hypothetical protein
MTEQHDVAMMLYIYIVVDVIMFALMCYVGFIPLMFISFSAMIILTIAVYIVYRMDEKFDEP